MAFVPGNFPAAGTDYPDVDWAQWQAGVSAEMDGEDPGVASAELRSFEAAEPATAAWLERAHRLNRRVRLGAAPPPAAEDFLASVLAAAPSIPSIDRTSAGADVTNRSGVGSSVAAPAAGSSLPSLAPIRAGLAVLALAVAVTAGTHLWTSLRFGQPLGAQWAGASLAMAAAMGYVAWRPSRTGPVLVLLTVAGTASLLASTAGVLAGRTSWTQENHHLAWILGAMLVGVLHLLAGGRATRFPALSGHRTGAGTGPLRAGR